MHFLSYILVGIFPKIYIYVSSILILLSVKTYKLKLIYQPRNLMLLVSHSKGYISLLYRLQKSCIFLVCPVTMSANYGTSCT